jgi:RHS repeat-associated protein
VLQKALRAFRPRRAWVMGTALVVVHLFEMATPNVARANLPNQPPQTFYYHLDHVGNVNVISDGQGNQFERLDYHPFGEVAQPEQVNQQFDISFNQHHWDQQANLYYFGARHYDPVIGRFVSADTQLTSGGAVGLNRYALNADNPIRFIDASGHDFWDWVAGITLAVLAVASVIVDVITFGATSPLSAVLFAAATGVLAGAIVGLAVGVTLYLTGAITSPGDIVSFAFAGAVLGGLSGGLASALIEAPAAAAAGAAAASAVHTATIVCVDGLIGAAASATTTAILGGKPNAIMTSLGLGGVLGAVGGYAGGGVNVGAAADNAATYVLTHGGSAVLADLVSGAVTVGLGATITVGIGGLAAATLNEVFHLIPLGNGQPDPDFFASLAGAPPGMSGGGATLGQTPLSVRAGRLQFLTTQPAVP